MEQWPPLRDDGFGCHHLAAGTVRLEARSLRDGELRAFGGCRGVVARSDRDPHGRGTEQAQSCPGDRKHLHARLGQPDRQPGRSRLVAVFPVGKGMLESINNIHCNRAPSFGGSPALLVIDRYRWAGRLLAVVRDLGAAVIKYPGTTGIEHHSGRDRCDVLGAFGGPVRSVWSTTTYNRRLTMPAAGPLTTPDCKVMTRGLKNESAFETYDPDKSAEHSVAFVHLDQLAVEHALGGR